MNRDFGNEQDMAVVDKDHPTLGPTEEAQDVATLPRNIVPMPQYTDPNNPLANTGTINLSLNDHPVEHSPDYGKTAVEEVGEHQTQNPLSDNLAALQGTQEGVDRSRAGDTDYPEDRKEWTKTHWQSKAKEYGLAGSGNVATLKKRVTNHEKAEEKAAAEAEEERESAKSLNAADWINEIESADEEELAELRKLYDSTGNDYSTVKDAFAKREAELAEDD